MNLSGTQQHPELRVEIRGRVFSHVLFKSAPHFSFIPETGHLSVMMYLRSLHFYEKAESQKWKDIIISKSVIHISLFFILIEMDSVWSGAVVYFEYFRLFSYFEKYILYLLLF